METKKTFGEYIKTKRVDNNLTQKEFASMLYVTESAISKWERGLSYPDITLISEICRILKLSEHELLTASEDVHRRNQEKLAAHYLALMKKIKVVQYFLYGIPLLVCLIVNIAIDGRLSWFFIVLASELVIISLTLTPMFFNGRHMLVRVLGFTISLIVLLAVCCFYTNGNWFYIAMISIIFVISLIFMPSALRTLWMPVPLGNHRTLVYFIANTFLLFAVLKAVEIFANGNWFLSVAMPITVFCLILPWGCMLIECYAKINRFLKMAGCLGLTTVLVLFFRGFIDRVLGQPYKLGLYFNFNDFDNMEYFDGNIHAILFFALLGSTVAYVIAGIFMKNRNRSVREKK